VTAIYTALGTPSVDSAFYPPWEYEMSRVPVSAIGRNNNKKAVLSQRDRAMLHYLYLTANRCTAPSLSWMHMAIGNVRPHLAYEQH